jgi:SAM-dependent methyltransferase
MTAMDPKDMEPTYVDENRRVLKGPEALDQLQLRKSEKIDPVTGVMTVDQDRWQEAQRYERRTWMEGIAAMSDRNEDHETSFGGYLALRGKTFASGIELGCGPFTNMRRLLNHCKVENIHLLDPLAADYLEHPFCRYKNKKLGGIFQTSVLPWSRKGGLKHPFRFYGHKLDELRVGGLFGRPVTLFPSGIEDFSPPQTYDLCVIINVIEHCRDASLIFENILKMTRSGSYFVFADKVYDAKEESAKAKLQFDAGHPLRVDFSVIENFLTANFVPIFNEITIESEGDSEYRCNYFIGVRK